MNNAGLYAMMLLAAGALSACNRGLRGSLMSLGASPQRTAGAIVSGARDTKKGLDTYSDAKRAADAAQDAKRAAGAAQEVKAAVETTSETK